MSRPSVENGDSPATKVGGRRRAIRTVPALDRLRRERPAEPAGDVPATSPRTDFHRRYRRRPLLVKAAAFAAVAALAVLLLRAFVVQPFDLPGNAMAPSLQNGDRLLVLKSGLVRDSIGRGEIVVFKPRQSLPCTVAGGSGGEMALRVVALPGEEIWSVGDRIFVDGRPLSERGWYDRRFGHVGSTPIRSATLASDQYFVMADRRAGACDSRVFGPIPRSSIAGKGIAVVRRQGHVFLRTL
ncbi:MAG: signal peptidase I [Thermoleophilaceae bacterium]|nr:signal peptidase I [Thermoleophilaceae bacterium]